jgi:uncharacterized membrane protein YfcA
METAGLIFVCALALFAGGAVKGIVGLGLPIVGVPLLTISLDLKSAVALLVMPLITSNFAQSFEGGLFRFGLKRFWPLLVPLFFSAVLSCRLLVGVPERVLFTIAGIAVIVFPLVAHFRPGLRLSPRQERWLAPLVGAAAGFLGGVSAFYGPPLMLFLLALRLSKTEFVAVISLMFLTASLGLAAGLFGFGATGMRDLGLSLIATVPVFAGMGLGQRIRIAVSEHHFKLLLLAVYVTIGAVYLVKGLR